MDEPSWTAAGVVPLRLWRDEVTAPAEPMVASEPSPDEAEKRLAAEQRAEAAERDRDWWMAQHDAIMEDWRADVEQAKALAAQLAAAKALPPAAPATPQSAVIADLSGALSELLQFYDPKDGSVLFQKAGLTLSEALKRATITLRLAKR